MIRAVVLGVFLVSCFGGHGKGKGGGGGGNDGGVVPGGTVIIVAPSVAFPQVVAGATLDFQAKVKNGNGNGVSWGVQAGDSCTATNGVSSLGVPGGGGNLGTIPANTANDTVATYTAPGAGALPPDTPFILVTVTALQSPDTSGPCAVVVVVPSRNALFAANFIFRLRGFASSGLPFAIIGRFNADGSGNIASGLEDVNVAQADGSSFGFTGVPFSGSYDMDTPRHGTMRLTIAAPPWATAPPVTPPPATMTFSFTLSLDGTFGALIETDGAATPVPYVGSGDFQIQGNSARFTTANIVGSYLLSLAGTAGTGASAVNKGFIGRLDLAASTALTGTIVNTSRADDQSGAATQTWTGTYAIDDQLNGHGVFNVGAGNPSVHFYIGGPRRFYALRTDNNRASSSPDAILVGVVSFLPHTSPFDNTSMGAGLFEMLGSNSGHASAIVGTFAGGQKLGSTTDGFLQGILDLNDAGKVPSSLPISFAGPNGPNVATFAVAPIGRGTISISLGGVTYNFIFYLKAQGVGFLLEQPASDGSNRGRSGSFFPQSVTRVGSGSFIASTEVATAASENGLAVLPVAVSGSSATLNGTRYVSTLGSAATSGPATGTFALTDTNNNRGTFTLTSPDGIAGSATAAAYLVSDSELIGVGTDATNTEPQILGFDQ